MRARRPGRLRMAEVCLALALGGCHRGDGKDATRAARRKDAGAVSSPAPVKASPAPHAGALTWYRAEIHAPSAVVPFFLAVPARHERIGEALGSCVIANGEERLAVDCRLEGGALVFDFPVFATRLHARIEASGGLEGEWVTSYLIGETFRFHAEPVESPGSARRFATPAPGALAGRTGPVVSGEWRLTFPAFGPGKAVLVEAGDGSVTGSILVAKLGDMRYLAGDRRGGSLRLSTFDGQHAYLVTAEVSSDGKTIRGDWIYPGAWRDSFTGTREASVDPAALHQIRLRPGATTVTIPQIAQLGLGGRPLVVEYFGTWCPACIDQTPFLAELRARYRDRGLEVLSIAMEATGDPARDRELVETFRSVYGVDWPTAVISLDDFTAALDLLPAELLDTGGFPVTLFIRRDGTVRAVHSGFFGKAAGADHDLLVQQYRGYVDDLVAAP